MVEASAGRLPVTTTGEDWTEIDLPEAEFTYLAGSTDRPWHHFTGRWRAIAPRLAGMFGVGDNARQFRLIDLGACTGFFALQVASQHPRGEVISVEGSVGIGNGTVGVEGTTKQLLTTYAVQTNLRWINNLSLKNAVVAPEVWDYMTVCKLAKNELPISDVILHLSVIHHIDGVSVQQYADAGLTRADGTISLISKLLSLAPVHFVELPDRPWLQAAYDKYGTQRSILGAAALATGREWNFVGPIYQAEWFGKRDLWIMEAKEPLPPVPSGAPPFARLFKGNEPEVIQAARVHRADLGSVAANRGDKHDLGNNYATASNSYAAKSRATLAARQGVYGNEARDPAYERLLRNMDSSAAGRDLDSGLGNLMLLDPALATSGASGGVVDPAFMALAAFEPCGQVQDVIGEALVIAPTALLVAHLSLREAIAEAEDLIREVHETGLLSDDLEGVRARRRQLLLGQGNTQAQGQAVPRATGGVGVHAPHLIQSA